MVSICRRPINCYKDRTRCIIMFIFHTLDLIFFIIRLSLVCNDISKGISDTKSFLIPILIFDLLASIPLIICNIIYVIMRCCIQPVLHRNNPCSYMWRVGTMTCIQLDYCEHHPQAILLMRIMFIVSSFILKFICFIIGASCSARFQSQCTAYAIIAGFALVASIIVIIVEFVNFFRLWNYNPTDKENGSNDYTVTLPPMLTKTHRRHFCFFHYSLLNDANSEGFRHPICKHGNSCKSPSLHHYLCYHSLETKREFDLATLTEPEKKSYIAFYQTNMQEALTIAEKGFPYGDNTGSLHKEYLRLRKDIFFTCACPSSTAEAIICVRLNLGKVTILPSAADLNAVLDQYFSRADGQCDTIYVSNIDRLYLRMPGQIEKWIVTIHSKVAVNDQLDETMYRPCFQMKKSEP